MMWDELPPECMMLIMDYWLEYGREILYPWDDEDPLTWDEWLNLDIRMPSPRVGGEMGQYHQAYILMMRGEPNYIDNVCDNMINKLELKVLMRMCKGIVSSEDIVWPNYVITRARKMVCLRSQTRLYNDEPVDWRMSLVKYQSGELYTKPSKYEWEEPKFKKILAFCSISKGTRDCCDTDKLWYGLLVRDFRDGKEYTRRLRSPKKLYLHKAQRVLNKRFNSVERNMSADIEKYYSEIVDRNKSINILKEAIKKEFDENSIFTEELDDSGLPKLTTTSKLKVSLPSEYYCSKMVNRETPIRKLTARQAFLHLNDHEMKLYDNIKLYENIRDTLSYVRPIMKKINSVDFK